MQQKGLPAGEVTQLLKAWQAGDPEGLSRLISLVYNDLRRMAATYMGQERKNHTLQPTALVHEVFQRLVNLDPAFNDREHFFRCACLMMRRLLVKYARARRAEKRNSDGSHPPPLAERFMLDSETLLRVHHALDKLWQVDPRLHGIVEMRFFMGFTVNEIAQYLNISSRTVKREWVSAKSWLAHELKQEPPAGGAKP